VLCPDGEGQLNVYAKLQNYFQGPVIQVTVKSHGNSSHNKPIFHTSKEECQCLALQHTPSEAVAILINDCDGEVHVQGAGSVGHDQMHIKNFQRKSTAKEGNALHPAFRTAKRQKLVWRSGNEASYKWTTSQGRLASSTSELTLSSWIQWIA